MAAAIGRRRRWWCRLTVTVMETKTWHNVTIATVIGDGDFAT
jgi:hypothetical protein